MTLFTSQGLSDSEILVEFPFKTIFKNTSAGSFGPNRVPKQSRGGVPTSDVVGHKSKNGAVVRRSAAAKEDEVKTGTFE
ncbi:hypothetical protein MHYP_G00245400 [Metynnis hypsauchen]